jgi:hypothetical protein
LIEQVDGVLAGLTDDGSLIRMAQAIPMTYTAPRSPDVRADATLRALGGD